MEAIDGWIQRLSDSGGEGSPDFEEAITNLLALGEPALRRFLQVAADPAIVPMEPRYGMRIFENRESALRRLSQAQPDAFLDTILDAVRRGEKVLSDIVLSATGHIRDDRAVEILAEALKDESGMIHCIAVRGLKRQESERAAELLAWDAAGEIEIESKIPMRRSSARPSPRSSNTKGTAIGRFFNWLRKR
jgi:hypothetical protein